MALSEEQKAMLRLLAQREQGYDDIAALMGLSVEEVRSKVAGALSQVEDEGEPAPDVPPPEPRGPEIGGPEAKTVGSESDSPAEPRSEAPKATPPAQALPKQPAAPPRPPAPASAAKKAAPAASASGRSSGGGRTITIPSGRGLWPWIGGAVAIIAIVVIVILVAGGGGGSSSSTEAATKTAQTAEGSPVKETPEEAETGETDEETGNASTSKSVTQAVLKPLGNSSASGKAIFGRVKNKLALQVVVSGLETTGKNDAYTIWLAQSEQKMIPLASSAVEAKDKGKIAAQYEVPTDVLSYLANGTFDQIYVTHTQNPQLRAAIVEATKKGEAPGYIGEPVLNGTVTGPIVGAALREEEEQEKKEKGE